jgi:hypothetical protein
MTNADMLLKQKMHRKKNNTGANSSQKLAIEGPFLEPRASPLIGGQSDAQGK